MKGDFSRQTFRKGKHYSGVLMQQGRVQLDADFNEQGAITRYRDQTEATDVIGASGTPRAGTGFQIGMSGNALSIGEGRYYVEGILCENDTNGTIPLDTQPDLIGENALERLIQASATAGLVYLDVWQRHVTALEDPLLRETALGGPDTTTRLQTIWQVKVLPLASVALPENVLSQLMTLVELRQTLQDSNAPYNDAQLLEINLQINQIMTERNLYCGAPFAERSQLLPLSTGQLNARTQAESATDDPCELPPTAGYQRLENQLYRVEIHTGGVNRGTSTFKWSRENGSIVTALRKPQGVLSISGTVLEVETLGRDASLGFKNGDWVEIVDDETERTHTPGRLARIQEINPADSTIVLEADPGAIDLTLNPKLRRWDQVGLQGDVGTGISMTSGWISLEGGIQVNFSEGVYHSGDYWMIPARTATGEIEWPPYEVPNINPQAQPAHGTYHHFCDLALVIRTGDNLLILEDCRELFPALTDIRASDVSFDPASCEFPAHVDTVQEALDVLCQQRDLRWHNKNLHGWGIVNGLRVTCDPLENSHAFQVHPGYALDCDGYDLILETLVTLDTFELIKREAERGNARYLNLVNNADGVSAFEGEYALRIERDLDNMLDFRIEDYVAPDTPLKMLEKLFKGTLPYDLITECVMPVYLYVMNTFKEGQEAGNQGVYNAARRRALLLTNLLVEMMRPENSSRTYISKEEHELLKGFYEGLRDLLNSATFCALYADARPFPDYPEDEGGGRLVYLNDFATHMRVHPAGGVVYAMGGNQRIEVRDISSGALIANLDFPDSDVQVRDVAFSQDGRRMYVAAAKDGNTHFAVVEIGSQRKSYKWGEVTVICDVEFMRLIAFFDEKTNSDIVAATGYFQGLYVFDSQKPSEGTGSPAIAMSTPGPLVAFTTGRQNLAFFTALDDGEYHLQSVIFSGGTGVNNVDTAFVSQQPETFDDICVALAGRKSPVVCVPGNSSQFQGKSLFLFDTQRGPFSGNAEVVLPTTGRVAPAYDSATGFVAVAYFDHNYIGLVDVEQKVLVDDFCARAQIAPIDILHSPEDGSILVLNQVSSSISVIDAEMFAPGRSACDDDAFRAYRAAALEAFLDLLGGLIQYLKDCLCDKLLIDPPTCDDDDKIFLACLTIRNGVVYKICNFSGRKYVKTFPTVDYWLSIIPIQPLISYAVELFCCSILPNRFRRYEVGGQREVAGNVTVGAENRSVRAYQVKNETMGRTALLSQQMTLSAFPLRAQDSAGVVIRALASRLGEPGLRAVESLTMSRQYVKTQQAVRGERPHVVGDVPVEQPVIKEKETPTAEPAAANAEIVHLRRELAERNTEITTLRTTVDELRGSMSQLDEMKSQLAELMKERKSTSPSKRPPKPAEPEK